MSDTLNVSKTEGNAYPGQMQDAQTKSAGNVGAMEHELLKQARALLRKSIALMGNESIETEMSMHTFHASRGSVHTLRQQADALVREAIKTFNLKTDNCHSLTTAAQFSNQSMGGDSQPVESYQSAMIAYISDIYSMLDLVSSAESNPRNSLQTKWVAPSSFERKTIKFWVHESKLYEVMLVLSTLSPLLVYGRAGRLSDDLAQSQPFTEKQVGVWETWSSLISSVYFDSPKFHCYRSRLAREQGSRLLRARWYGKRPKGSELIHLELKTHNEKWVNEKSIKQRVSIQAHQMKAFLSGDKWTIVDAKKIVAEALPKYNPTKTEEAAICLLSMHEMVVQFGLRPCLRTVYKRAAFQSSTTNALRFTVDKKVTLIKEHAYCSPDTGAWCYDDDTPASPSIVKVVPYAVMEVKLAGGDMPKAIEGLEQDGVIIRAEKFSKFLTGTASFNLDKLKTLPYWADHPAFTPLFQQPDVECSSGSQGMNTLSTRPDTATTFFSEKKTTAHISPLKETSFGNPQASGKTIPIPTYISVEGRDDGVTRSGKKSNFFWNWKKTSTSGHVISSKTRLRVEPKTFFANERTLIQWITGALLLMTAAALLIDIDDNPSTRLIAFFLVISGAFIVCYGVFVYFRRIHLINTGKAYGYVDYVGPILLACCVLGSVIVLSYFIFHTAIPDSEVVQPSIHSEHGLCEKYTFTELSDLEFQPSDVVVDAERKILLIPSLTTIVSVPLYQVTVSVPEVLIDIPGADIEALTAVGDRLFAVREDGDSTIHELQWDAGRLRKVREFLIPTNHVEGITFVPDSKESSTVHLYVAGSDRKTQRVSVDVYQIPSSPDTSNGYATVEVLNLTKRSLNANLLTNGLEDPKIASLAYFEDLLYVLHDNDRLVRSWDVKKGKMLAEWKLPHVVGGFAKQWEGMALERRSDCSQTASSALLRGWPQEECQSSLYLHLTLDTPPQIWTLTVKEDATANRTLLLPSCAPSFDANYTTIGNQH